MMRSISALLLFCLCASAQPKFYNYSHEITQGLVGWWRFNDGNGTNAMDSSGNGLTGILTNGATWSTGPNGTGCVVLDGANDFVSVINCIGVVITGKVISVSCWINPIVLNSFRAAWDSSTGVGNNRQTCHLINGTNQSFVGTANNLGSTITVVAPFWTSNEWQHCVVTCDGTSNRVYRGAIEIGSSGSAAIGTGMVSAPIWIGGNPSGGGTSFAGMIDDFRIYNRVLNISEIIKLLRNGAK